jgi:hypothetical protein
LKVALSIEAQSFGVALLARSPNCSHEIEFSFLNGNLIVPARRPVIFDAIGDPSGNGYVCSIVTSSRHLAEASA